MSIGVASTFKVVVSFGNIKGGCGSCSKPTFSFIKIGSFYVPRNSKNMLFMLTNA
jgi:hypothetical protein